MDIKKAELGESPARSLRQSSEDSYEHEFPILPPSAFKDAYDTLHMTDGSLIDMVLVNDIDNETRNNQANGQVAEADGTTNKTKLRVMMLRELRDTYGFQVERVKSRGGKKIYTLLHVTQEALYAEAELSHLRVPLKKTAEGVPITRKNDWYHRVRNKTAPNLKNRFEVKSRSKPERAKIQGTTLVSRFRMDQAHNFKGSENPESLFSKATRSALCGQILENFTWGSEPWQKGIEGAIGRNLFQAYYPLHDGPLKQNALEYATSRLKRKEQASNVVLDAPMEGDRDMSPMRRILSLELIEEDLLTDRQWLTRFWGNWDNWRRLQPQNRVMSYFGENIAFYFVWLGLYTQTMILPAIVGIAAAIYGLVIAIAGNDFTESFCDPEGATENEVLCSTISSYEPQTFEETCTTVRLSVLFDNAFTLPFTIVMALWASLYLEFWKRRQSRAAYEWFATNAEENSTKRPQFKPLGKRVSPVTGDTEEYYPRFFTQAKQAASGSVLLVFIFIVFIATIAVVLYRVLIKKSIENQLAGTITASVTGAIINVIVINILGLIYTKLARVLTDWENHQTKMSYRDSLNVKEFLFNFFNTYSPMIYIAFYKPFILPQPGERQEIFGVELDSCPPGGCMAELGLFSAVILVSKGLFMNVVEMLMPTINAYTAKMWSGGDKKVATHQPEKIAPEEQEKSATTEDNADETEGESTNPGSASVTRKGTLADKSKLIDKQDFRWEADYELSPFGSLDPEYMELVIQFGTMSLFVPAFPLAPALALLNNVIEMRLDATKFLRNFRRPIAERAQDIGTWQSIFEGMAFLAVVFNALIIGITSEYVPRALWVAQNGSLNGYVEAQVTGPAPSNGDTAVGDTDCVWLDFQETDPDFYYQSILWRVVFILLFEHIVFLIVATVRFLVPDVPQDIKVAQEREEYQAFVALHEYGRGGVSKETAQAMVDDDDGDEDWDELMDVPLNYTANTTAMFEQEDTSPANAKGGDDDVGASTNTVTGALKNMTGLTYSAHRPGQDKETPDELKQESQQTEHGNQPSTSDVPEPGPDAGGNAA
eukprot:Clim_evm27s172 gene=Clim_evmTU27s172